MDTRKLILFLLLLSMMVSGASAAIPENYRFYFDFEEGTGSTANNANSSYPDMTLYGSSAQLWTYPGGAYFNGTTSSYGYIADGTNTDILDKITIAVNTTPNANGNAVFISKYLGYQLRLVASKPQFSVWADNNTEYRCASASTINTSASHYIVGTANGTHLKLYIDESLVQTLAYPTNQIRNSPNNFYAGMVSAGSNPQKCTLYDAWVYTYAVPDITVFSTPDEEEEESPAEYGTGDAVWDPDGWSGKPYLKLYNGSMNMARLATHTKHADNLSEYMNTSNLIYQNETDGGWDINNTYCINAYTGYLNFSNGQPVHFITPPDQNHVEIVGTGWNLTSAHLIGVDPVRINNIGVNASWNDSVFDNVHYTNILNRTSAQLNTSFFMNNLTFYNFDEDAATAVKLQYGMWIDGGILENLTFDGGQGGLIEVANAVNTTMRNVYLYNGTNDDSGTGIYFSGAQGTATYTNATGGHDNVLHDVYLYHNGRSAIALSQYEYDFRGWNLTVDGAGHNNIDLHGQWNVTMWNVTSINCLQQAVMITSPNAATGDSGIHNRTYAVDERLTTTISHNITLEDFNTSNSTGAAYSFNRCVDVWLKNSTSVDDDAQVALINTAADVYLMNVSSTGTGSVDAVLLGTGGTYGYTERIRIIDCNFTGNTRLGLYASRNTSVINSYFDDGYYEPGPSYSNDMIWYQYPKIKVVDALGNPVQNVTLTSNTSCMNGEGESQSTFYTGADGYIDFTNLSNRMAVPDFSYDDTVVTQISSNVTATYGEYTNSTTLNPDSTWYSSNTSDLQAPEKVIILSDYAPGAVVVTAYSPVDTTPSAVNGSNVSFSANLSASGFYEWLLDSSVVGNGTGTLAAYNYTASSIGDKNITIRTADDQQTWIVTITEATGFGNPVFTGLVFFGAAGAFAGLIFLNQRRKRGAS